VKRTESTLRLFLMLMLSGLLTFCAKAESTIRVHMIDARSGMPIANSPVRLWTHDAAEERKNSGYVQEMTDSNGVATFRLNDPIPSYLYIHIGMGAKWEECFPASQSGFATHEILESGVSKESACWKLPNIADKFHPTPADVYIFAVHDSFIERVKALGH
jgi:hypothetical protein